MYLAEIHKQQIVCLVVDEAFEPSRTKGKFKQTIANFNKELGFQELNMSLAHVNVDPARLAEFIFAIRGASPSERVLLLKEKIANL